MTKRVKYDEQRDMIEKNITKVENKSSIQRHQSDEEMLHFWENLLNGMLKIVGK